VFRQVRYHLQKVIYPIYGRKEFIEESWRQTVVVQTGQSQQLIFRAVATHCDGQKRKFIKFERVAENPNLGGTCGPELCRRFIRSHRVDGVPGGTDDPGAQT
jgi:hypothetical protein